MTASVTSSSQRFGSMGGSRALSHAYIQYPPFRCDIPGSLRMMYDDGNRLLLVPTPNKVFSWPVAWHAHADSPSVMVVDEGPVLAARFSLDVKILGMQRSDHEVAFFNRERGVKFRQMCRSGTDRILGFFWTDCPSCDIVFVTSSGLELYSLVPALDALKLVDVKLCNVSWHLYSHESRLVLLASGAQCKTFLCYQFSAGEIIRLPKFDASMRKAERKALLGPEDVHIATMYGRLYCLQVDRASMELNIFRFYRDAVVPQGILPIYSENVAFSVVDGVLLVHQLASKVVLLYDVFTDIKTPISAPLPLLLQGHNGYAAMGAESFEDPSDVDETKGLTPPESNIYGDGWVFANPDIILDHAHGILWRIHLDLEAFVASTSDAPSLLAFLQRRRLDAAKAKQLSMAVLRSMIVEKRPLPLISEAMDIINTAYSQFIKTRSSMPATAKHCEAKPQEPTIVEGGGSSKAVQEEPLPEAKPSFNPAQETEAGDEGKDTSAAPSSDISEASFEAENNDGIAEVSHEDMEKSSDHAESSGTAPVPTWSAQTMNVSVISPEEMHHHVFAVVEDEMQVESSFLAAAIFQYISSAAAGKVKVPLQLQVLLIQLFAKDGRNAELVRFVQSKILEPSREVAVQLLEVGKSFSPIHVLGLNMLRQLSVHADYLSSILHQGRLLEALRYARQNRVEAIPPSTFLELAATEDPQKLASVIRFCLDFVPSFEQTPEYDRYSAILKQQNLVAAR